MSIPAWIGFFLLTSLFWAWVLFWGGAEWLEGSFTSGFLIHIFAPRWSAEGIKLFALFAWLGEGIWFVIGLFVREARLWW